MGYNAKQTGQRIRDRRRELDISIVKAALELNISSGHLRKIESGSRVPPIDLLYSISDYYHVSISYLLSGEPELAEISSELELIIEELQLLYKKVHSKAYKN